MKTYKINPDDVAKLIGYTKYTVYKLTLKSDEYTFVPGMLCVTVNRTSLSSFKFRAPNLTPAKSGAKKIESITTLKSFFTYASPYLKPIYLILFQAY